MLYLKIVLTALMIFYLSCSKDGGSGGGKTVGLKATLSALDYTVAKLDVFDRIWAFFLHGPVFAAATTVNQTWAVPIYDSSFSAQSFSSVKKASIGSDGSFSIDINTSTDWLVILLNTNASETKDQVVGYVTMTASDLGLQKFKTTGDLDLGELSKSGDETRSTRSSTDNAGSFEFTADQLAQMAKNDDTLKVVKNVYTNYDESSGVYTSIKPFYLWRYSSATSAIKDTYASPATVVTNFAGYLYYFNSNHSAMEFSRICAKTDSLALYPPAAVTNMSLGGNWNPSTPINNSSGGGNDSTSGTSCQAGNLYLRDDTGQYGSGKIYEFNFSAMSSSTNEYLKPPIVAGDWSLKVNSTTIATFDGQLGSPFENSDTAKPFIFIPSLKLTTSSNIIQSISVKFYQRSSSGTYDEITDSTLLSQMSNLSIELSDYSGGSTKTELSTSASISSGILSYSPTSYSWAIPSQGSGTATASDVALSFDLNGVSYRFEHRMQ